MEEIKIKDIQKELQIDSEGIKISHECYEFLDKSLFHKIKSIEIRSKDTAYVILPYSKIENFYCNFTMKEFSIYLKFKKEFIVSYLSIDIHEENYDFYNNLVEILGNKLGLTESEINEKWIKSIDNFVVDKFLFNLFALTYPIFSIIHCMAYIGFSQSTNQYIIFLIANIGFVLNSVAWISFMVFDIWSSTKSFRERRTIKDVRSLFSKFYIVSISYFLTSFLISVIMALNTTG